MSLLTKVVFGSIASFYCGFYVVWTSLLGHKLKDWYRGLDSNMQHSLQTAATFQYLHAIALFIVVFSLADFLGCKTAPLWISSFFALGILFFSFSLYLRAFYPLQGKLALITPLGGIFLLLGWSLLLLRMLIVLYNIVILDENMQSCATDIFLKREVGIETSNVIPSKEEKSGCCK